MSSRFSALLITASPLSKPPCALLRFTISDLDFDFDFDLFLNEVVGSNRSLAGVFLFYLLFLLIQIRTHAIRKAHENIDKTLKAAEVILAQFDLSRQVCFLLIP